MTKIFGNIHTIQFVIQTKAYTIKKEKTKQKNDEMVVKGSLLHRERAVSWNKSLPNPTQMCFCYFISSRGINSREHRPFGETHSFIISPNLLSDCYNVRPKHTGSELTLNKADSGKLSEVQVLRNMMNSDNIIETSGPAWLSHNRSNNTSLYPTTGTPIISGQNWFKRMGTL